MEAKTDFKSLSTKAKIEYIWDYYKWHILITIIAVLLIGNMVYNRVTYRAPLLSVIMINSNEAYNTSTSGFDEFEKAKGYDSEEYPISLSAGFVFSEDENSAAMSYNEYQALAAMIAAGDQDLFFGTGDVYLSHANEGALADLSTILSPELLEKYEDHLLYSTAGGECDPYPCAIELTDNEWLRKYNYYNSCYFGIFYRNQNPEACKEFAEFLLTYE